MNKKASITMALGLFLGTSAFAQSASEFTVSTKQGNKSYKIADVRSMVIEGNNLLVTKSGSSDSDSYQLADITSIIFNLADGIAETKLADGKLSIYSPANSNLIYVKGYELSKSYDVTVYGSNGNTVMHDADWKGQPVDVSKLPNGVYIFKINNSTFKFRK